MQPRYPARRGRAQLSGVESLQPWFAYASQEDKREEEGGHLPFQEGGRLALKGEKGEGDTRNCSEGGKKGGTRVGVGSVTADI